MRSVRDDASRGKSYPCLNDLIGESEQHLPRVEFAMKSSTS